LQGYLQHVQVIALHWAIDLLYSSQEAVHHGFDPAAAAAMLSMVVQH
jgi:hypothetical protein